MATPGSTVVRTSGKLGVFPGGQLVAFNTAAECPACCDGDTDIGFAADWLFTDIGFIDGGQVDAFRSYSDPGDATASPWTVQNGGFALRLDWEDDINCAGHNPFSQQATARGTITTPVAVIMTVDWSGIGETRSTGFEQMQIAAAGQFVGSAGSPGGAGDFECGPMAPVISDPELPQEVMLTAGDHGIVINAFTNDANYHTGTFYEFALSFREAS